MKKHIATQYSGVHRLGSKLVGTLFLLFVMAMSASAQDIIRVTGKVIDAAKGEPLAFVNIMDMEMKKIVAQSDGDGRFSLNAHSSTSLRFSMTGAETQTIKLRGRDSLVVRLTMIDTNLGEAAVVVKRKVKELTITPTPIEMKGNMAYFKNVVGVPSKLFGHDCRLVAQRIFDNQTRKKQALMRPMVYDAVEYNQTQDRMYDFKMNDKDGDPLAKYILVKDDSLRDKHTDTRDAFMYMDSIFVKNPNDIFRGVIYAAIEDYNKIVYRDTIVATKGVIRPMRWLDFSFGSSEIADDNFIPKSKPQLRDSKGNIDLRFPIGKAEFDPNDAHNVVEIQKLQQQVQDIAATKDATVQALNISGTSSPDGRYTSNLSLAKRRMDYAINYFRMQMPENLRRNMKFSSNASVAPWGDVVKLMRKDSLDNEANQVESVTRRYKGDAVGQGMKRLSFYKSLLQGKYLPMLRSVGYTMNYSIFRNLTLDEIKELYNQDYKKLSRYEFFRMYRSEENEVKREKILRQALEIYPSFTAAANDLSALLIQRGTPDPEILRNFAGKKLYDENGSKQKVMAPAVVNQNQMVALLVNSEYQAADSLVEFIPKTEENRLLLAVNDAFMGRYDKNYDIIAQTGLRNEIVLLLAMKKDEEALEKSKVLTDDDAVTHYIKAICMHRSKDSNTSLKGNIELRKALTLDPSLIEIAENDADVNDLECIKEIKDKMNKKEVEKK